MRRIIIVLVLACAAFGQASSTRVPPDEAAKHIISKPWPAYPPLAEQARIQGNVILEVPIYESGTVSAIRLVSGHPLLAQAALEDVKKWKFRPFELDGKPVTALTFVMVTFGSPADHGAADRAEMLFQDKFWTALELGQADLGKADYSGAESELNKAGDLLAPVSDGHRHTTERWRWATTMGNLAMAQRKDEEAEQHYKQALALYDTDKDAPYRAATLVTSATCMLLKNDTI
jgi:TonB family protein